MVTVGIGFNVLRPCALGQLKVTSWSALPKGKFRMTPSPSAREVGGEGPGTLLPLTAM
jgi:hypothetical protein